MRIVADIPGREQIVALSFQELLAKLSVELHAIPQDQLDELSEDNELLIEAYFDND